MPAKPNTKKVAPAKATKETKAPAKGAKKPAAKGAKAAKPERKATATITSPARVRQHINYHGVNNEINLKLNEFNKQNEKITTNKDVVAIKKDESLNKKYLDILKFRHGDAPKSADTKEKRDKWIATQLAEHKKTVAAAIKKDPKLATFAKDFNLHEARRVITNDMKRFSRGSYVALAAAIDEIILDILRTAMAVVISHDKRMLTSAYCATRQMESSQYYCLFSNIKPYVDTRARLRELAEQNDEEEEEDTPAKGKGKKAAKKAPKEEEEESEEDAGENAEAPVTRTFTHYVGNIAKTLTGNPDKKNPFQHVRMSNDVKIFCSDIITAILANLGVALGHLMGNAKTINESLIRNAFATMMAYNGADSTQLLASIDKALATLAKSKGAKASPAKGGKAKPASDDEEEDDDESDEESSESDE